MKLRSVYTTPYNHAPCHFMQSHIRKVYVLFFKKFRNSRNSVHGRMISVFCLILQTVSDNSHSLTFAPFICFTCYNGVFLHMLCFVTAWTAPSTLSFLFETRVQRLQKNDWNPFYSCRSFFFFFFFFYYYTQVFAISNSCIFCKIIIIITMFYFVLRQPSALCLYSKNYRQCYFIFYPWNEEFFADLCFTVC